MARYSYIGSDGDEKIYDDGTGHGPNFESSRHSWPCSLPSTRCTRARGDHTPADTSASSGDFWAGGLHFTRKGDVFTSGEYSVRKERCGHYAGFIWRAEGERYSSYGGSPKEAAQRCVDDHRRMAPEVAK
jgi:hypothetical protein